MQNAQTEEERIAAMFQAGGEQWEQQQQYMASAKAIHRGGYKAKNVNVPDHEPPPGYICYRCGEKGHWIQICPTNDDPHFDGRPRVKRTTGIPRSFLRTIEKPAALSNDGLTDTTKQPSGVMVNAEGEFVVAEPDKASWEQFQAKAKASAAQQEAAVTGSEELRSRGLECSIDKRIFVDPMKTPCCGKTYCNDCIENALVNSDLVCPGCSTEGVLIDNLVPDEETNAKIKAYEEEQLAAKMEKEKEKEKSKSPTPVSAATATAEEDKSKASTLNAATDGA
ncbi:Protein mpe1, partial [Cryomyces antarcticus]